MSKLSYKIIALLFACLFWLQMILLRDQHVQLQLPVIIKNIPADLIVTKMNLKEITVNVKAQGYFILLTKIYKPVYELNGLNVKKGSNYFRVNSRNFTNSKLLKIKYEVIIDSIICVEVDRVGHKFVRVKLNYANEGVTAKYAEKNFYYTPQKIQITGPIKGLDTLISLNSPKLELSDLNDNNKIVLEKESDLFQIYPQTITLHESKQIINEQVIKDFPVSVLSTKKYRIVPNRISMILTFKGRITSAEMKRIRATIDLRNAERVTSAKVSITTPVTIKVKKYTPERVQVYLDE